MPYTLLKLVMVVVPDFSGGSMENYGLITYCEAELLHDDLRSAAENTQRLLLAVTHEVGQQWFRTWGVWISCSVQLLLCSDMGCSIFGIWGATSLEV
nr:aminopeptidase M1-like isoform X2 [Tanacetum cinerariifolium]